MKHTNDVATRMRQRIRARLDELGMTARELARAVRQDAANDREVDAWISGVLKGDIGLHWKHFDAVCDKLRLSPAELVRHDNNTLRELTPTQMRLLRHYEQWPDAIQQRWLAMLDHFAASVPDKDTAMLLDRVRSLPSSLRRPVMSWLFRLLDEGIPPTVLPGGAGAPADAVTGEPRTAIQTGPKRRLSASRARAADQPGRRKLP